MKMSMMVKAASMANAESKNEGPNISGAAKKLMSENGLSIEDIAARNKSGNIGKPEVVKALASLVTSTSNEEEE